MQPQKTRCTDSFNRYGEGDQEVTRGHWPTNLPLLTMEPAEQTEICVLSSVMRAAAVASFLDVGSPYTVTEVMITHGHSNKRFPSVGPLKTLRLLYTVNTMRQKQLSYLQKRIWAADICPYQWPLFPETALNWQAALRWSCDFHEANSFALVHSSIHKCSRSLTTPGWL